MSALPALAARATRLAAALRAAAFVPSALTVVLTVVLTAALSLWATDASAQITLSFGANPPPLVVSSGGAGQAPSTATSPLSSWSLLGVWLASPKITAQLQVAPPPGVTLEVNMSAPLGATSAGWVTLTTTPKDVVTNLPLVALSGIGITYRVTATSAAGVVALTTRNVVYTVVWPPL